MSLFAKINRAYNLLLFVQSFMFAGMLTTFYPAFGFAVFAFVFEGFSFGFGPFIMTSITAMLTA
ncbi:MAG: hypothetical protein DHS20C18_26940 [Saprospiraceae bacterium]|nr:MAG: hypothetical protein DHS20C18_26940 [Saprospiraceae bacterium]